jgi:hypothetical protein
MGESLGEKSTQMSVDQETSELIRQRSFPVGGPLGRGELALEAALEDETIPKPKAWLVQPPDEEDAEKFATIYLLAEGALYRLRARADAGDEDDPSECACDFIRIDPEARFSLAVVRRWAGDDVSEQRARSEREIVRTWRFSLGTWATLDVQTSSLDEQAGRCPERAAFAIALASAVAEAS